MLVLGGDVNVSTPPLAVKSRFTTRCSKFNACVLEPARTSATEAMSAAFGVVTGNQAL